MRELARGRTFSPSQTEFILFLGCILRNFPRPKSYCPEKYCGTWREFEGPSVGSIWRLSPQGGMRIEGATPYLDKTTAWCLKAVPMGSFVSETLKFAEKPDRWYNLYVEAITADTMLLQRQRYKKRDYHRFERVSLDHGLPDVWVTI